MPPCFLDCPCNCRSTDTRFDCLLASETNFEITVQRLALSNVGWFCDLDDLRFNEWRISKTSGVYALWHKDEYCADHDLFHCKALYIGKGRVKSRIYNHAKTKHFGDANLVCFSYLEIPNRKAKYVEQLLLDLYNFPMNSNENTGKGKLCYYLTQSQADFGTMAV